MKNSPEPITMGDRIKQLRKERGWSQQDLENRSGVSKPVINLIENNRTKNVSYGNMIALANAFEVDPNWLAGIPTDKPDKGELITDLEITIIQIRDIIKRLRNL